MKEPSPRTWVLGAKGGATELFPDERPIDAMSVQDLMEAWAETGDKKYLTPEAMEKMGMVLDEKGDPQFLDGPTDEEMDAEVLARLGVDVEALRALPTDAAAKSLLPLASKQVTFAARSRGQVYTEEDRDSVRRELSHLVRERPEQMVKSLFGQLDPSRVESLGYIRVLEEEAHTLARWYRHLVDGGQKETNLYGSIETALIAFADEAQVLKSKLMREKHGKYFVLVAISDFCSRMILSRAAEERDSGWYTPFKLTKGVYAAFSPDGNRIFVADEHDSEDAARLFREHEGIEHGEGEREDASLEEMFTLWERIIDNGVLVSELLPKEFSSDPSLVYDYALLLHRRVKPIFEEDLGIRLSDLSLREQVYFLRYAKEVQYYEVERLKALVGDFKTNALRTFLATAYDPKAAEYIFAIAEKWKKEDARAVFEAFTLYIDEANRAREGIEKHFPGERPEAIAGVVQETLMKDGVLTLKGCAAGSTTPQQVEGALKRLKDGTALTARVFSTMQKSSGVQLSDVRGAHVAVIPAKEFRAAARERAAVESAIATYYEKAGYPEAFQKEVLGSFTKSVTRDDTTFYMMEVEKKDGGREPVVALRFDDKKDGTLYFGSVIALMEGGKFGEILIQNALTKELEEKKLPDGRPPVIEAHCNPMESVTSLYLEAGFCAESIEDVFGVPSFHIRLDSERNKEKLGTKAASLTKEKIAAEYPNVGEYVAGPVTHVVSEKKLSPEVFARYLNASGAVEDNAVPSGTLLTRYFKAENGLYYAVFERPVS